MEKALKKLLANNVPPKFKFKDTYESIEVPTEYQQFLPTQAELEAEFDEMIIIEEALPTVTAAVDNLEVISANLYVNTTTGNVGIGTSTPGYALDVVGDVNLSGDFYQGGEPFVSSEWTSGANSLYYRSNVEVGTANLFVDTTTSNVGVGTSTPGYALDVVGDINLSGDFYQGGEPFVSSLWTSGIDSLYYRSNVEVGTANLFVDTTTGNVGVGTASPTYKLDVRGTSNVGALTATSLSGNGSGLTSLNAANISSGTIHSDRLSLTASDIPSLDASKITAGTIASARLSLTASDIPSLNASKITAGTLSNGRLNAASTTGAGIVQLSTITNGSSTTKAATESAVKAAYDRNSWGSGTFSGDLAVAGNLTVSGATTTVDTTNLTIKDTIVELGKDNTVGTTDLGIIMRRPGSNVGIIYDGSASKLEIGHTLSGASESTITMDTSNALVVNVNGSLTATTGTFSGALTAESASNDITILAKAPDTKSATLAAYGTSQGTGRLYVGQGSTYGGGIEYNGDNSPASTGAGADYIALYRVDNGVYNWTARNYYNSNNWEFRGTVTAPTFSGALSGNATTATTLATARAINGVNFNGSTAITITANTPQTLTRGSYLTGSNFNGGTATTWAVDATEADTASKIVARNSSGDINCRLVRPTYSNQSTISGAMAFRVNNSNDNYIRFCSDKGAIRTFLDVPTRTGGDASGTWGIAISGNATTATTLATARAINGVDFNGSTAITITANTPQTLTRGSYLTGSNFDGGTATTWAVDATTAATVSKIVARDSSGDIYMRYGHSSYLNMSHSAATRSGDTVFYSSTDNYIRKNNSTGFRASLNVPTRTGGDASGTWGIAISGNAATATTATNQSGGTVNATTGTFSGALTASAGITTNDTSTRDKFRVWTDSTYTIGMQSGITFGPLNDYGMTFQMNNDDDRGFWWGDTSHTVAQGAMALSTRGWLSVAERIKVGGGQSDTGDPSYPLHVVGNSYLDVNDTLSNQNYNGVYIDYDNTGTDANTGNRTHRAFFIDYDSSASGGTATSGQRNYHYAMHSDMRHSGTGNQYVFYNHYLYTRSDHTSGTCNYMRGIDNYLVSSGTGLNTEMWGINTHVLKDGGSTGATANMYGSRSEVEVDAGTVSNGYSYWAHIDRDGGTLTNGYLYYGSYAGTVGTKWGLYLTGETKNYFSGNVGIGTTSPGYKLDVNGTVNTGALTATTGTFSGAVSMSGKTLNAVSSLNWDSGTSTLSVYGISKNDNPAFYARKNTGQGIGVYIFNIEELDTHNGYNNTNGRYTAQVAGRYVFTVWCMSNSNVYLHLEIRKNGSRVYNASPYTGQVGSYANVSGTIVINLAVNDYIDINVLGGSAYGGGNDHNGFCGYMIG